MNSRCAADGFGRFIALIAVCAALAVSQLPSIAAPATQPATHPATRPALQHTAFVTVLLRDWSKWDTNGDGTLSIDEIDRVVVDPAVKGDDAAVAGTLKLMSRSTRVKVPVFTRAYFLDYDRQALVLQSRTPKITPANAEAVTTDTIASGSATTMPTLVIATTAPSTQPSRRRLAINWDLYFIAGQKRISRGGDVVWPAKFTLDNMRQGPLGDCFLVATIGAMVAHHPSDLTDLIKPLGGGDFLATFPNAQPFTLHPLTQSQLVLSSTSSGDGVWLAVVEQAYGKFREKAKGSADEEGTDIIANGGNPGTTLALMTGHQYRRVGFAVTAKRRVTDESRMLPLLRKELIAAFREGRLVTASVTPPILNPTTQPTTGSTTAPVQARIAPPTTMPIKLATTGPATRPMLTAAMLPKIPPNITTKHAYAVLSYDPATDMLEIWNPHGQQFTPKGPDGLANGYTTIHGRFHISAREAATFFTAFTFELSTPTTQPATTQPTTRPAAVTFIR
jgi:hypothetical protein